MRHTSGYLGFDVPLPRAADASEGHGAASRSARPVAHYGAEAENVIAVRVDASFGSGHWHETASLHVSAEP